jgi:hypothetical protein
MIVNPKHVTMMRMLDDFLETDDREIIWGSPTESYTYKQSGYPSDCKEWYINSARRSSCSDCKQQNEGQGERGRLESRTGLSAYPVCLALYSCFIEN